MSLPLTLLLAAASAGTTPAAAAPAVATLTNAQIQRLQEHSYTGSEYTFLGISVFDDEATKLHVGSNRQRIAWKTAQATSSRGRYTPPADVRRDIVTVSCGDSDFGKTFNCSGLHVTVRGRRIKPLAYVAGPNVYKNAMGVTWRAHEATATYAVRDLKNGFEVEYASTDGTSWTHPVSEEAASSELLLDLFERPTDVVATSAAEAAMNAARPREVPEKIRAELEQPVFVADEETPRLYHSTTIGCGRAGSSPKKMTLGEAIALGLRPHDFCAAPAIPAGAR